MNQTHWLIDLKELVSLEKINSYCNDEFILLKTSDPFCGYLWLMNA